MKDLKMLSGVLAIFAVLVPASWGVFAKTWDHKVLQDKYAELSSEFIGTQLRGGQKDIWQYQDRLKAHPEDNTAAERLRQLEYEQKLLEYKQNQLKKEGK